MHAKANTEKNVCKHCQHSRRAAKRVNQHMAYHKASETNREIPPDASHCVNSRIQAVNAAHFLLEQVFQVCQRVQYANCRHQQRQQIQHSRAEFNLRAYCSEVTSHHRSNRALHVNRSILRGQQPQAGCRNERNQSNEV